MKSRTLLASIAAILTLGACSGDSITGLSQLVYNATYKGQATLLRAGQVPANMPLPDLPLSMTMVLSQLGQNFTGTFTVADSSGQWLYAGSVTGKVTSAGADITMVVPSPCAGTLYGSFTVPAGALDGTAAGRDCVADAPGNNVQITFTNLVRQ